VHYPSDVLVGGLLGFGLAHGLNFLYLRWIQPRLA
jgi:membrane-associated phospholipid phosphatase